MRAVIIYLLWILFVLSAVHFGMKFYDDQLNAQAVSFILFIYLLLPHMLGALF
jgi:hypothetical protein